jgi:hypothetical protein
MNRSAHRSGGKSGDTLQPLVCIWFRFGEAEDLTLDEDVRLALMLTPDHVDRLAEELTRWAARARDKHYE